MGKRKFELCEEVLRRFEKAGILDDLVLVGSWCVVAYRGYFGANALLPAIRTRDVDLLVPAPSEIATEVDVETILDDLGFIIDFRGEMGWTIFNSPELIVEFLTPARGRSSGIPRKIGRLGVNAMELRFLDMLHENKIKADFHGVVVNVPHPASFAVHKLIVAGRRTEKEKGMNDRSQALAVINALKSKGELDSVKKTMAGINKKWLRTVFGELADAGFDELADFLA